MGEISMFKNYIKIVLHQFRRHKGLAAINLGGLSVGLAACLLIESEYPEVEDVVYMRTNPAFSIEHGDNHYFESMFYADNGFFHLFDFPFVEGGPETALAEPSSLVLSDTLARKLFGESQALNRTLLLGEDSLPRRSHIRFDALLYFETLRGINPEMFEEEMAIG
jgi:hypothetical protein